MDGPIRNVTIAVFLAVLALLVVQVAGLGDMEGAINAATIALLLLAGLLCYALVAPEYVVALLNRIEFLKVPGFIEAKLRSAERIEERTVAAADNPDDVKTSPRPRDGDAATQFDAVRDKLQERLRFIRDAILDLPGNSTYGPDRRSDQRSGPSGGR